MVGPRFAAEPQVRQRESRRQFGDKLFDAVGVIAEALAKHAIASVRFGRPVPGFMRPRAVVVEWRVERAEGRQCDRVLRRRIERAVTLMAYARADRGKEPFGPFNPPLQMSGASRAVPKKTSP